MNRLIRRELDVCIAVVLIVLALTQPVSYGIEHVYLRADTTTVTMPDGQIITMWGFAQDSSFGAADGNVTVPGPLLTIPVGENTLTIHLDNNLTEPVSIIIPGQIATMTPVFFTDGQGRQRVRSFTHETDPLNATEVTYTWIGLQPGTYVYQSGTHPTVQIQMGLYGCMKKDQSAGSAYSGVDYDNEVILFYSEIDPALHQAVATGNYGPGQSVTSTINYLPKYFLVNGQPYSATAPPLALDAGNPGETTLLRFLNMGLRTHVPVVNGLYMTIVAEDGRKYPYSKQQYSIELPAGKTKDATITPDTEAVYPIYDRRLSLTNAALSPGGMFSLLDVGNTTNIAPTITSVTATPSAITDKQTSQLQVIATDLDARPAALSYNWIVQAGQGSLSDVSIANPLYTPPDVITSQTFSITVEVSDGGDTVSQSVSITVHDGDVLLLEVFNDGDFAGWTIVDQGTLLAPSSWSAATGTMIQSSNIYSEPTLAGSIAKPGTYAWYAAGTGWFDYQATLTISSDDDDAIGLMFRYQNANNYYRFCWDKQRSYRRLIKIVNGTATLLAEETAAYVTGQSYQLEITVQGSSISVSIDSVSIFTVTDSSLTSGSIALYAWGNAGSHFDDILVRALNQAPSISSVTATPSTITDAQTSQLQVTATDPDSGPAPLSYTWTVQAGQGSLSSTTIANPVYTPPDVTSTQTYTISVQVSDGADTATGSVNVSVTDANAPGPVNVLTENFNDGNFNGWSIVDQGTFLAPSNWSAASGTMTQSSNIYSEPTLASELNKLGTIAVYSAGSAWTDYTTTATIRSDDDDGIGLLFRYQNTSNYYKFCWDKQRSIRRLLKKVGGTVTLLASDSVPYVTGQSYLLEITATANSIVVAIDSSTVFSVTDSGLSSGTIALYSWGNAGSLFDDITVDDSSGVNIAPVISSVTATPSTINDGETSQLQVTASDPDSSPGALTYNWIVQAGQGSVSNSSIANPVYTPPDVASTQIFTITVEVSDGADTTSDTVTVTVQDAAAVPLLSEDFADGDFVGWSIIDQGPFAGPSSWSAATGTMVQSTNIYSEPTLASELNKLGTIAVYNAGSAWTDYQVVTTISSDDDDSIGLLFRYQDTSNYYKFCWDKQRSTRRLLKKVAGTVSLLASDSVPYVTGQSYTLQINVSGSSLQVRIDGSLIFSVTDSSLSSGSIALYSWGNAGSFFDDIMVTD